MMTLRAAVAILAIAAFGSSPAAAGPSPLRGAPAPAISLPIIANGSGRFVLAQEAGHGVYINFFASWCQPCREEANTIGNVTPQFVSRGVRVIGIAVLDDPAKAKHFALAHGLRYPIAYDGSGDVGAAYRVNTLPLHVFVGPDGIIKQYVEGGPIPASELRTGLTEISTSP